MCHLPFSLSILLHVRLPFWHLSLFTCQVVILTVVPNTVNEVFNLTDRFALCVKYVNVLLLTRVYILCVSLNHCKTSLSQVYKTEKVNTFSC